MRFAGLKQVDSVAHTAIAVAPDADVLSVSDELAERDPALAQLAAAAVSGLAPVGPELRRRPVEVAFDGRQSSQLGLFEEH